METRDGLADFPQKCLFQVQLPIISFVRIDAPARRQAEQRAWYFYDWANSAFPTAVVTTFLGPYLTAIAKRAAGPDGFVYLGGIPLDARSVWGYTVALSVILQVLILPPLGAWADHGGRKKQLLGAAAYLGASATMLLYFLQGANWQLGVGLFVVANVAFGAGNVIYNSFLPDIAAPEERDRVSSRGWGIGYLGGGLALALNLLLYLKAESFGITEGHAVRISLLATGVWWAVFTLIPLFWLKNRPAQNRGPARHGIFSASFGQLFRTLRDLRRYPQAMVFLIAYLLYNDAIQAVIALSSQFGSDELAIPMSSLTSVILMVQFVAFLGAMSFGSIAARIGAKRTILTTLIVWTGVLGYIYSVQTAKGFFIAAAFVALVMGGSQALSRSLFSQMIPRSREAEYFGLYEVSDKGTSWLAPLFFGLALQFTKSYRLAILSLITFFILGFLVLLRVNVNQGKLEAAR